MTNILMIGGAFGDTTALHVFFHGHLFPRLLWFTWDIVSLEDRKLHFYPSLTKRCLSADAISVYVFR